MLFSCWQTGLDIQCDGARAVALSRHRHGWCLRRWWYFPHALTAPAEMTLLPEEMDNWHRQLPLGAQLRVAFPGVRTLQRAVAPVPQCLSETQRTMYLAATMGRQLSMNADELSLDYCAQPAGGYAVTAARRQDVDALYTALRQRHLAPVAIAPDASALQSFLSFITGQGKSTVISRSGEHWLWANHQSWGAVSTDEAQSAVALCQHLGLETAQVATCCRKLAGHGVVYVDPWSTLRRLQPPLPPDGDRYAVALGLALARVSA